MIKKKMYQKIQKFKRQGYSSKRVAHKLGINPRTAAKYFKMDEEEFRAYRREHLFRDRAFSGYESDILEVYEENNYQKLNMSSVYDYLEERHGVLPGSEQTLRNFTKFLFSMILFSVGFSHLRSSRFFSVNI
jgi:hypothetical protein